MDKNLDSAVPVITIAMPAYNAAKYIRASIDSILDQTYPAFILMIINDGSTDDTEKIILSYSDKRIVYIKNDKNMGLLDTLNKSVELTQTEYYGRMDADDIAVKERLQLQIDFMKTHPEIGVCGGMFVTFGNEKEKRSDIPLDDAEIKATLLFSCKMLHPSIVLRTEILKKNNIRFGVPFAYNDEYGHKILELEDYALWHKLKTVTTFANLETVLIKYRKEGQNLSTQKLDLILERKKTFYTYLANELGVKPSETNLMLHISLSNINRSTSVADLASFRQYLDELLDGNKKAKLYDPDALQKVTEEQWSSLFFYLPPLGLKYVSAYRKAAGRISSGHFTYALRYFINKILRRR